MRIQDYNPVETTATRTEDVRQTERASRSSGNQTSAAGEDRVDLSGLSERVSQALETSASEHSARVQRLARDVAAGRYQPDAMRVSRAMVAQMSGSREVAG